MTSYNQTDPKPELLPCQKCDGDAQMRGSSDGDVDWYQCRRCGYESPPRYNRAEAIAAWNKRTPPTTEEEEKLSAEQVERVARAIVEEIGWGSFSHFDPEDVRRISRAALAAITTPAEKRIVEWLRFDLYDWPDYVAPADIADAIERGDYRNDREG